MCIPYGNEKVAIEISFIFQITSVLKVIRKFFLKHNKSFRWHLGDYEKHNFFHLKACERRNFDFCVFLRVDSLPNLVNKQMISQK